MADNKDFSDENILECGIKKRYINDDRDRCAKEIAEMIKAQMQIRDYQSTSKGKDAAG